MGESFTPYGAKLINVPKGTTLKRSVHSCIRNTTTSKASKLTRTRGLNAVQPMLLIRFVGLRIRLRGERRVMLFGKAESPNAAFPPTIHFFSASMESVFRPLQPSPQGHLKRSLTNFLNLVPPKHTCKSSHCGEP